MKDYYYILGLASYEDSQDVILSRYKEETSRLSSQVMSKDVKEQLIEINEAFLVLSDSELKRRYDYALSTNSQDETLMSSISAKREKAVHFITGKLDYTPKRRKKYKWPAIICGILVFSALVKITGIIYNAYAQDKADVVGTFSAPFSWSEYEIKEAFSIAIPNTMELRHDYDKYTQWVSSNIGLLSNADAVFQQKGLSDMSEDGYKTYARVLIQYYAFSPGEVEHHYESPRLTSEDYRNLREIVDEDIKPYTYVDIPTWRWIEIGGTKAIEGTYRRNGSKGPVKSKIYLLPNYDEMAIIVVAFREKDSDLWESDLNKVIRTFKWKYPK